MPPPLALTGVILIDVPLHPRRVLGRPEPPAKGGVVRRRWRRAFPPARAAAGSWRRPGGPPSLPPSCACTQILATLLAERPTTLPAPSFPRATQSCGRECAHRRPRKAPARTTRGGRRNRTGRRRPWPGRPACGTRTWAWWTAERRRRGRLACPQATPLPGSEPCGRQRGGGRGSEWTLRAGAEGGDTELPPLPSTHARSPGIQCSKWQNTPSQSYARGRRGAGRASAGLGAGGKSSLAPNGLHLCLHLTQHVLCSDLSGGGSGGRGRRAWQGAGGAEMDGVSVHRPHLEERTLRPWKCSHSPRADCCRCSGCCAAWSGSPPSPATPEGEPSPAKQREQDPAIWAGTAPIPPEQSTTHVTAPTPHTPSRRCRRKRPA